MIRGTSSLSIRDSKQFSGQQRHRGDCSPPARSKASRDTRRVRRINISTTLISGSCPLLTRIGKGHWRRSVHCSNWLELVWRVPREALAQRSHLEWRRDRTQRARRNSMRTSSYRLRSTSATRASTPRISTGIYWPARGTLPRRAS